MPVRVELGLNEKSLKSLVSGLLSGRLRGQDDR